MLVSYVAGVLLWIYFFDDLGPEQGFGTIMAATGLSPAAFVFGLIYGIWVYRKPRLFWYILALTLVLVIPIVVIMMKKPQNKKAPQTPVDQLVLVCESQDAPR